ncbi:MAG: PAP2 family protein [Sulfurovum sp.]|nr:MAG: PAP2 family protein [Sulfurovum sp.]
MSMNKQIVLTTVVLMFTVIFFGTSDIDIVVQDKFFDASTHHWIVDKTLEPYKFIFYDGIKKLLILFAVSILLALIFLRNNKTVIAYRKGLILIVLSAIFVPLIVGGLKKATNMPCPKNEIHYGGVYPSTKVWESYPPTFKKCHKICCFPAAHASGGFALLSLFFLFRKRRNKILALVGALTVGWSMGLYKMLIGDHFLSHTVISMILAWLIVLVLQKIVVQYTKT